jgi:hypothetical protein
LIPGARGQIIKEAVPLQKQNPGNHKIFIKFILISKQQNVLRPAEVTREGAAGGNAESVGLLAKHVSHFNERAVAQHLIFEDHGVMNKSEVSIAGHHLYHIHSIKRNLGYN